tara:strand:- start:1860 stop:2831 length:972 start_codon:yes stop_codon:yes gene_type:complete
MKFKLFVIFFIGFLEILFGEIKAEEICFYSNVKEFKKCKKNNEIKILPNYPLVIENQTNNSLFYFFIWAGDKPQIFKSSNYSAQNLRKINFTGMKIESSSEESIQIQLAKQTFTNGIFGGSTKINSKRAINIDSNDILSWNYSYKEEYTPGCLVNCEWRLTQFNLNYLDNLGNKKEIKGNYRTNYREGSSVVENLLENISKLKNFESKNVLDTLNSKLKRNEKRLAILKSIILIENPSSEECLSLNEVKFPQLSKEFKQLSKTINPLRKKLSLPRTNEFENICGEIPGQRPLWMEEKIKGCYKYPTKKQRDYCIKVYSPYGKE